MRGDLNARSKLWDRKYNTRGYYLEEWMATNELVIMNDDKDETCIRAQGSSMVDITLGTEAAMKTVRIWEVDKYTETLSDHKYIQIKIDKKNKKDSYFGGMKFPRWNLGKIDKDWFAVSVLRGNWLAEKRIVSLLGNGEIRKAEQIIKRIITDACENAGTRDKGNEKGRNRVYWWSKDIAVIRGRCSMWRRRLIRAKGRKSPGVTVGGGTQTQQKAVENCDW